MTLQMASNTSPSPPLTITLNTTFINVGGKLEWKLLTWVQDLGSFPEFQPTHQIFVIQQKYKKLKITIPIDFLETIH